MSNELSEKVSELLPRRHTHGFIDYSPRSHSTDVLELVNEIERAERSRGTALSHSSCIRAAFELFCFSFVANFHLSLELCCLLSVIVLILFSPLNRSIDVVKTVMTACQIWHDSSRVLRICPFCL